MPEDVNFKKIVGLYHPNYCNLQLYLTSSTNDTRLISVGVFGISSTVMYPADNSLFPLVYILVYIRRKDWEVGSFVQDRVSNHNSYHSKEMTFIPGALRYSVPFVTFKNFIIHDSQKVSKVFLPWSSCVNTKFVGTIKTDVHWPLKLFTTVGLVKYQGMPPNAFIITISI